jgi:hypothetical protein
MASSFRQTADRYWRPSGVAHLLVLLAMVFWLAGNAGAVHAAQRTVPTLSVLTAVEHSIGHDDHSARHHGHTDASNPGHDPSTHTHDTASLTEIAIVTLLRIHRGWTELSGDPTASEGFARLDRPPRLFL